MMEIDFEKFEKAPDYLAMFLFIQLQVQAGKAKFGEKNNKVIELEHDASNYFAMGRDENQKPFIGVQESMNPWFFNIDWSEVALAINDKYSKLYLIARDKEDNIILALGLKVKQKRLIVIFDPVTEDIESVYCNIKVVVRGEDKKEILTSYNNMISGLKVNLISDIYDVVEESKTEDYSIDKDLVFIKKKR